MSCPDLMELERYVQNELDDGSLAAVQRHLSDCATCAGEVDELRANLELVPALRRQGGDGAALRQSSGDAEPETFPEYVGPYRIVRRLGQGGMGAVYEARQENPSRGVALKMIRPGLVSRSLLSRFRHEAQVLGRLRHPGIAQIYEAGTHRPPGAPPQPYFAMELVHGPPLLAHADAHRLDARQRLDLLARVCDAVQHAHERGVIHRDLKPDNILVDESVRPPQPKILDFGVARAVDPDAAAANTLTLYTTPGQIVGTVAYMSPEQASGAGDEIDTRSDVYALGVIGYQLLARRLPYRLSAASIAESVRTIVQDEPATLASVDRALRGDATTIIGKALNKEKPRRYQSAAEMAEDIRRHLRDEPITAHPPSTVYQLGKFARRNKGLVAGVAAAFVVLVGGVVGTSIGLLRERAARDAAERARTAADASAAAARLEAEKQAAVNAFLQEMLGAANPRNLSASDRAKGRGVTVVEAMDAAAARVEAGALAAQPEIELAVRHTISYAYQEIGLRDQARRHIEAAVALARRAYGDAPHKETVNVLNSLAILRLLDGDHAGAEALAREAWAMGRQLFGDEHALVFGCTNTLALALQNLGRMGEAEALLRQTLEGRRRLLGERHADTATSYNNLSSLLEDLGRLEEAEPLSRRALELRIALLGEEHPDVAVVLNNLGFLNRSLRRYEGSEAAFRRALAMRVKLLGDDHPTVAVTRNNLGSLLQELGRLDEAEPLYVAAIEAQRRALGARHPTLAMSINNLASLKRDRGDLAAAEPLFRESLGIRRAALGDKHPAVAVGLANLAATVRDLGRPEEAEALSREAVALTLASRGKDAPETAAHRSHLGLALLALGRYGEAEEELLEAWRVLETRMKSGDRRAYACATNLRKLYEAWGKPDRAAAFTAVLATTRPAPLPLVPASAPAP